jgi:hypothetical protein
MSIEQFERELRELLRAEPFQPFEIVVSSGRTIYIDEPAIAFGGGKGGFIGPGDAPVEFFDSAEVVEFRPATMEPRS